MVLMKFTPARPVLGPRVPATLVTGKRPVCYQGCRHRFGRQPYRGCQATTDEDDVDLESEGALEELGMETAEQFFAGFPPTGGPAKFEAPQQAEASAGTLSTQSVEQDDKQLAEFIKRYDKPGDFRSTVRRTSYPSDDAETFLVPIDRAFSSLRQQEAEEADEDSIDIRVHVTLPERSSPGGAPGGAPGLPVVFFFNCFAMGLQRCEWYFDFADRLASWGYAVVQYETTHTTRFVNGKETEAIVNFLLKWATTGGAPGVPSPCFEGAALDPTNLAFVGHSKGGSDAAYMLAKQPKDTVKSTMFGMDAVDTPMQTARRALKWASRWRPPDRAVCLVHAPIASWFNLPLLTKPILSGAKRYCRAGPGVLAATAVRTAHFGFVARRFLFFIRLILRMLGSLVADVLPAVVRKYLPPLAGLEVDTWRNFRSWPWWPGRPGIFNQCAGLMVAWLEGTYRASTGDSVVSKLARQHAGWGDHKL